MANLQVNQIRKHLTDNYIRFVDASRITGRTAEELPKVR